MNIPHEFLLHLSCLKLFFYKGGLSLEKLNNMLQTTKIWMPTTLEEAVALKKQFGQQSSYVAGATLLQLRWQSAQTMPQHLITLENLSQLQAYQLDNNALTIGALTKLSTLRFDAMLKSKVPAISEAIKSIAAPAVRNRGTVGGNIMGGEGDLIPLFLAMQAQMTFLSEYGLKTIAISDWVKDRQSTNDLLVKITIPAHATTGSHTFYKKIGRRETFTAAIVTVSGQVTRTELQALNSLTLAIGGSSNKPLRLINTEQYMTNKTVELIDWKFVYQSILEEYCPAGDAFITNNYKKKVAANLIISELQSLLNTHIEREAHVYEM